MYLQSAVRLAGHWLRTVTSVRWAHVGSEESLILLRGARASFMAVGRCAKKINRERPEKKSLKSESEIWAFGGWFLNRKALWLKNPNQDCAMVIRTWHPQVQLTGLEGCGSEERERPVFSRVSALVAWTQNTLYIKHVGSSQNVPGPLACHLAWVSTMIFQCSSAQGTMATPTLRAV